MNDIEINELNNLLQKKRWGCLAKGKSPGNKPRFYIFDYKGLALATGYIRYHHIDDNHAIFYRGQNKDHEIIPSLYRLAKSRNDINKLENWRKKVLEIVKESNFDKNGLDSEREALAQHYGLQTQFLDVVDNFQTALWFACQAVKNDPNRFDETVGYIHILKFPLDPNLCEIIDLRKKPSEWLRPHVQQAYCVRTFPSNKELGRQSKYLLATFIIPLSMLEAWSNYRNILPCDFFPNVYMDPGLSYWNNSLELLNKRGIELDLSKVLLSNNY